MKITDAYGKFQVTSPVITGAKGAGGAAPVGKGAGQAHVHSKDAGRVQVSDEAKALEAKSSGDSAKIERLKASIADGSFKVDAKQIASKLVGDDEEPEE
ncbi:MAG: flagellar biosynthesis anti-sigma factor FlgM [Polyangiaceae bacterium]